jgi:hypothetical protein
MDATTRPLGCRRERCAVVRSTGDLETITQAGDAGSPVRGEPGTVAVSRYEIRIRGRLAEAVLDTFERTREGASCRLVLRECVEHQRVDEPCLGAHGQRHLVREGAPLDSR